MGAKRPASKSKSRKRPPSRAKVRRIAAPVKKVSRAREEATARQQLAATAEILKVISESPADAKPVFEKILGAAVRLCHAAEGAVFRFDGNLIHLVATHNWSRKALKTRTPLFPRPPDLEVITDQVIRSAGVVRVVDALNDPHEAQRASGAAGGWRRMLGVPMLREGAAIGVIVLAWPEPGKTPDQQVALLQTFADQAVIAIENVRLFNETKEALEQQTASAEILKVISRSPTDVQPVFDAIVASAARLFGCNAAVNMLEGDQIHLNAVVSTDVDEARIEETRKLFPAPFDPEHNITSRTITTRAITEVTDTEAPDVPALMKTVGRRVNVRSITQVPLIRDGTGIGALGLTRATPGLHLNDKQRALLQTFADQAVIAIENVRLFKALEARNRDLTETLDQQTATSEILSVISSSPTDVQPIFDAIVRNAVKLCSGVMSCVFRFDGERIHFVAHHGFTPKGLEAYRQVYPLTPTEDKLLGRAVLESKVVNVADVLAEYRAPIGQPELGHRSALAVPMLREGVAIGVITVARREPGLFPESQVELLKTFADQAVIAIENVRLFNETREALERQTATAEILKVISESPTDVQPVFDAIVRAAVRLCDGRLGAVLRFDGEFLDLAAHHNFGAEGIETFRRVYPARVSRDTVAGCAFLDRTVINLADAQDEATVPSQSRALAVAGGFRSVLVVPMLREGEPIGIINVARVDSGQFSQAQVDLLETFADQAVIAIENVRLFNETKDALERQTATAEILQVISSSPTDVQPVFDAIVQSAVRLCEAVYSAAVTLEDGVLHLVAHKNWPAEGLAFANRLFPMPLDKAGDLFSAIAIRENRIIHQDHMQDGPDVPASSRELAIVTGYQALLMVPMVREDHSIGVIVVARKSAFSEHQIALLKTFADQAVIAVENVRLFSELKSRTEALTRSVGQLTALGEVGQAITSTLDLDTVLKTIVSRARQLTGLDAGVIYEYDEGTAQLQLRASENLDDESVAGLRDVPLRKGEGAVGRSVATREPTHVPDTHAPDYPARLRELLDRAGFRAVLAVSMLREDQIIGALMVFRKTAGPFAPDVADLLKTFATQSALAIQNARLFREIEDKGRQLEEASQHKSQFLASMSHELRTPLNAILGFNEMIIDQVYGEVPADVMAPLENIQTSGKHLLRLINNVLDLAKIEAGRMELALADYAVNDVVESVRSTLQPLAAEKGLEFAALLPDDLPLAYGDFGRITQCLMNLAGNSLKFTKSGSVTVAVEQNGATLVYRVADTGIGIAPDKVDALFTEFKQTDATIASEYGGTGLGLSISKQFIEMHGGRIWVESELGRGSTFIFEIPLRVNEGAQT